MQGLATLLLREEERNSSFTHPHSTLRRNWQLVFFIAIAYNAVLVPFAASFGLDGGHGWWILTNMLIDAVYVLDIVWNFYVGVEHEGGILTNQTQIRRLYLRSRFTLDALAVLPLDYACLLLGFSPRVYAIWRLPRLLRLERVPSFFSMWERESTSSFAVRIARFCCTIIGIAHWIACVFFGLIFYQHTFVAAYKDLSGFTHNIASLLKARDARQRNAPSTGSLYARSLFWAVSLMTGAGPGHELANTTVEFVFQFFVVVFGVLLFATILGQVADAVADINRTHAEFRNKMDAINRWMGIKRVPETLRNRVRNYFNYVWMRHRGQDDVELLEEFPRHLRTDLHAFLCQDLLKALTTVRPFDQIKEEAFLLAAVGRLTPEIFTPGEYITRAGEAEARMFIVTRGSVERVSLSNIVLDTIMPGRTFGEAALLCDGLRARTMRAQTYVEVFVLEKAELDSVLAQFPQHMPKFASAATAYENENSHANLPALAAGSLERTKDVSHGLLSATRTLLRKATATPAALLEALQKVAGGRRTARSPLARTAPHAPAPAPTPASAPAPAPAPAPTLPARGPASADAAAAIPLPAPRTPTLSVTGDTPVGTLRAPIDIGEHQPEELVVDLATRAAHRSEDSTPHSISERRALRRRNLHVHHVEELLTTDDALNLTSGNAFGGDFNKTTHRIMSRFVHTRDLPERNTSMGKTMHVPAHTSPPPAPLASPDVRRASLNSSLAVVEEEPDAESACSQQPAKPQRDPRHTRSGSSSGSDSEACSQTPHRRPVLPRYRSNSSAASRRTVQPAGETRGLEVEVPSEDGAALASLRDECRRLAVLLAEQQKSAAATPRRPDMAAELIPVLQEQQREAQEAQREALDLLRREAEALREEREEMARERRELTAAMAAVASQPSAPTPAKPDDTLAKERDAWAKERTEWARERIGWSKERESLATQLTDARGDLAVARSDAAEERRKFQSEQEAWRKERDALRGQVESLRSLATSAARSQGNEAEIRSLRTERDQLAAELKEAREVAARQATELAEARVKLARLVPSEPLVSRARSPETRRSDVAPTIAAARDVLAATRDAHHAYSSPPITPGLHRQLARLSEAATLHRTNSR